MTPYRYNVPLSVIKHPVYSTVFYLIILLSRCHCLHESLFLILGDFCEAWICHSHGCLTKRVRGKLYIVYLTSTKQDVMCLSHCR